MSQNSYRMKTIQQLQQRIIACRLCPRLVEYREWVARTKRRMYREEEYWGRPVPGFGDPFAKVLVVGLAPAAHGGNRTGRVFTGDRSGDWVYGTLYRFGFANQPHSVNLDDGIALKDVYITAAARCAPPANKPLREELQTCRPYLLREMELLKDLRVVVALGKIAFDAYLDAYQQIAHPDGPLPKPRPRFGHGATYRLTNTLTLIASYHPSQQNTQTGRLTRGMFDSIFAAARSLVDNT